jgi:hypothetical protein
MTPLIGLLIGLANSSFIFMGLPYFFMRPA